MKVRRLLLSASLAGMAVFLGAGCAALRPSEAPAARPPLPAARAPATLGAAPVEACVPEGESCSAEASSCCTGYICAGINASICIARY